GMSATDGLELGKVNVQVLPGRRENRYFVSGTIENTGKESRLVPTLRVTLADEAGAPIYFVNYHEEVLMLEPDKNVPFSAELENRSTRVAQVQLDLGNRLELWLR